MVNIRSRNLNDLNEHVRRILDGLIRDNDPHYGFGNISSTAYDTAWVSMIAKRAGHLTEWLCPYSFQYLLATQAASGGWGTDTAGVDSILNTLAGLLALKKHAAKALQLDDPQLLSEVGVRISKAAAFLEGILQTWDVEAADYIGFELLVPAHLELLEQEGFVFQFKGKNTLIKIRDKKLAKYDAAILYTNTRTTAVHSLEAFVGKIDFDRLAHRKTCGSMMGSPSSTAAYLIYSSVWDVEAEGYIRNAVASGYGKGDGGAPNVFPSSVFEIAWLLTTLFDAGFTKKDIGEKQLHFAKRFLLKAFASGSGLVGFAPGLEADADDTGKGIAALGLLGSAISPTKLIEVFEEKEYFKTFTVERNPSLSTNCNVLNALLQTPEPIKFASQITKCLEYICSCWWENGNKVIDKWNVSPYYPIMLLTQGLTRALILRDQGRLSIIPQAFPGHDVVILLWQILTHILANQSTDGSWGEGHTREATAYVVITLNALTPLPICDSLRQQVDTALENGRGFLWRNFDKISDVEYLWIGKVTYGLNTVSQAYILGALKCTPSTHDFGCIAKDVSLAEDFAKSTKICAKLPIFSTTTQWKITACQIKVSLFSSWLRNSVSELDIFPREHIKRKEIYIDFIPLPWIASNCVAHPNSLTASTISDILVLSVLLFQVDEFIEDVIRSQPENCSHDLRKALIVRFGHTDENVTIQTHKHGRKPSESKSPATIIDTILRFVDFVLLHPRITAASPYDKRHLHNNLLDFLLSNLTQLEDSNALRSQSPLASSTTTSTKTKVFSPNGISFFKWSRTLSADHIGLPLTLSFLLCLVSRNGEDSFKTAEAKYVAEDVARHMAGCARMYNDYGSVVRDREENNLNGVNFPEFSTQSEGEQEVGGEEEEEGMTKRKKHLLELARYEERCVDGGMKELEGICGERVMGVLRAFRRVVDVYCQMYVARDLSPRLGDGSGGANPS